MARRKLRDLRVALQARLGFGSVEQPALTPILNSFLYEAQYQLFKAGEWKELNRYWDMTVPVGSANVAYPTDATVTPNEILDPDTVTKMAVDIGSGTPSWNPVTEGITLSHYNTVDQEHHPARYERRSNGFEFWPTRDVEYTVRVWGKRKLSAFEQDGDVASLDDSAIFLVALADAKGHYRQPDAQVYQGKASTLFAQLKHAAMKGIKKPPGDPDDEVQPRPVVV